MVANETALLQQYVNRGSRNAFSEIVRRHASMVYAVGLRVLRDESRAADVVQETFLQLLGDADRVTGSLATWLHRIATHKAIDAMRKERRRRKREAGYAAEKRAKTPRWRDISLYIDEELEELEEEARQILIQYFFEGRTTREIAADAGISQPTVSRRLEAGLVELRGQLSRRGILVSATAFVSLLGRNATEAAPSTVLKELGKIALAGPKVVLASAEVAGVATGGSGKTVAGGVLASIKTKVVAAAVIAAVGSGGAVTYNRLGDLFEQLQPRREVVRSSEHTEAQGTPGREDSLQGRLDFAAFKSRNAGVGDFGPGEKLAVPTAEWSQLNPAGVAAASTKAGPAYRGLSKVYPAAGSYGPDSVEECANRLIAEGAVLSPVNAVGDAVRYVADIGNGLFCGVSHGRLKIFPKDNVNTVVSSYWLACRVERRLEYYEGHVYLLHRDQGIWIFDVTAPSQIRHVGRIKLSLGAWAEFEVNDGKIYVVNYSDNSLVVFSLEEPSSPKEIMRHSLGPAEWGNSKSCVRIVGDRIYLLADRKLVVLEAGDISPPKVFGSTLVYSGGMALGSLIVREPYAYVFVEDTLRVFDVSDPQAIEEKASVKADWCNESVPRGERFIGFGNHGVFVWDISEPLNPTLVKSNRNTISPVLITKSVDYLVGSDGSMVVLTDPSRLPKRSGTHGFEVDDLVIKDDIAYAFCGERLRIFDISRSWSPMQLATVKVRAVHRQTAVAKGNYVYTLFQVIDARNPAAPSVVSTLAGGSGLALAGNLLLVAKDNSLEAWDVNDPAKPKMIKRFGLEEKLNKVFVHKGVIYLGFYSGVLRSCYIDEQGNFETLDEMELSRSAHGIIMDIREEEDFLYLALHEDGIASVGIQDPNNLKIAGRFNTSQFSEQVEVVDAFAYIADGSGGVVIVDMVDKGFEKQVVSYPTSDWTRAVAVSGNYVYSCEGKNGIMIFVSNLEKLKQ
ncbi:MAG: sigma-70 family RNA polymerase sigma factor [Planctomycetota bacterium]|jgi:RNA polymerase sigma-70 factor (ECF subfamily)